MRIVSGFDNPAFNLKNISLEDAIQYSFSGIELSPCLIMGETRVEFTDQERPVIYGDCVFVGQLIGIHEQYYLNNQEAVDKQIVSLIKNYDKEYFFISGSLLNDEILAAICNNKNIKRIRINDYKLDRVLYDKLYNSPIEEIETEDMEDSLKNVFGGKIASNDRRCLIKYYNYEALRELKTLDLYEPLTDEEIQYLDFINDDCKIKVSNTNDFNSIFKMLDKSRELGKKFDVKIRVQSKGNYNYKNEFNAYLFSNLDIVDNYPNLMVGVGILEEYDIKEYLEHEKRLVEMIRPAINLSPLEKFYFAYNIVKKYKKYKEVEDDDQKNKSRNLYDVLDGDFMVCVGYATMLGDLLDKLGVPNRAYGVSVDVGLDKVARDAEVLGDDVLVHGDGHARLEVSIVDPKYGVDGIYISDPTWDNELEEDCYNCGLMSQDEYNGIYRYSFNTIKYNVEETFFVHSLEEFFEKANLYMNYRVNKDMDIAKRTIGREMQQLKLNINTFMQLLPTDTPKYEWFKKRSTILNKLTHADPRFDEFIAKAEQVADKTPALNAAFKDMSNSNRSIKSTINYTKKEILKVSEYYIKEMISIITQLDREKGKILADKYVSNDGLDKATIEQAMLEIGEYVVNRVNKTIPGETIMSVVRELYNIYYASDPSRLETEYEKTVQLNKKRQELVFPIRYRIDRDGERTPILNETNKFDFDRSREFRI